MLSSSKKIRLSFPFLLRYKTFGCLKSVIETFTKIILIILKFLLLSKPFYIQLLLRKTTFSNMSKTVNKIRIPS